MEAVNGFGEDMDPLRSSDYQIRGRVVKYLGLMDAEALERLKDSKEARGIFDPFYDDCIKPQIARAQVGSSQGQDRGQREKQNHFKAVEAALNTDDQSERNYRKRYPSKGHDWNDIDRYAYAISQLTI